MTELLPCPFCGGEARIERDHDSENLKERWSIWHECCEHEGESMGYGHALFPWYETPWYYTEAEAVAAWNTRAERTCHRDEYEAAPFSVCSECGAVLPDDCTVYYCWSCGAKVVE